MHIIEAGQIKEKLKYLMFLALKELNIYDDVLFKGYILIGNDRFKTPRADLTKYIDHIIFADLLGEEEDINGLLH